MNPFLKYSFRMYIQIVSGRPPPYSRFFTLHYVTALHKCLLLIPCLLNNYIIKITTIVFLDVEITFQYSIV